MRKSNLPLDSRNSSLELHSADFGIFGASQTPSLVSAPKIPKNYESQTENPSVVLNSKNAESTNLPQQTIEGIAVEVLYLEKNLGAKLDLKSVSLPNFSPSAKDTPKSELSKNNTLLKNAVAITGGIATGKSTACNILKLHGYSVIDTDSIAHEALEQSKDEIVSAFGDEILECDSGDSRIYSKDSNPRINRKKLGAIVFNDKAKLATLESILHPKIRAEVKKQAQKLEAQGILYFIDIPLFFELKARGNGYEIPRALLIYAPKELQLARMQKRDSLSADEARIRLANQMDIEAKRQMADFVIENVGNIRDLQSKIETFLKQVN